MFQKFEVSMTATSETTGEYVDYSCEVVGDNFDDALCLAKIKFREVAIEDIGFLVINECNFLGFTKTK